MIGDFFKGIRKGITAKEVCKQRGEYDYIDLLEENMAPCQHAYLYRETVAKVLGIILIRDWQESSSPDISRDPKLMSNHPLDMTNRLKGRITH